MASKKTATKGKKLTLRDRKKAQPDAVKYFSEAEKKTIQETVARDLTNEQARLFFYQCQALGLNPLTNEICAVVYKTRRADGSGYTKQMSIQVMRDGFLTIAHRSGKFAGMESGVIVDDAGKIVCGWARVHHKDFTVALYQEADFEEYNAPKRNPLWATKPKTMIKKVAESMALRKAFNVNGVYSPEEFDRELEVVEVPTRKPLEIPGGDKPASKEQIKTIQSLGGKPDKSITKQEAVNMIDELISKK